MNLSSPIALSLVFSVPASAIVTVGWNASSLTNGSVTSWAPNIDTKTPDVDFEGTGTKASGSTNFSSVNNWVNSPNYIFDDNASSSDSWHSIYGDAVTQQDVTFEMVFRPGDYTGKHTLFNTGGNGDGLAFVLDQTSLEFRFQDGPTPDQQAFATVDLSSLGPADVFYHIVGIADLDNPGDEGTSFLYVNGVLQASASSDNSGGGGINDWDGADDAELGTGNNIAGGNPFNPDVFTGDIAIFNYHENQILSEVEIGTLYSNLGPIPEPSSVALTLLGIAGVFLRRKR